MYHIYQQSFSPHAEDCADLILQSGGSYEVHIIQCDEDLRQIYRMIGRPVSMPRVFIAIGNNQHHIGGRPALVRWFKDHHETEFDMGKMLNGVSFNLGVGGIPVRQVTHQEVRAAFLEAMKGRVVRLTLLDTFMEITTRETWEWLAGQVIREADAEQRSAPSLALYLSVQMSHRVDLNCCGIMMDSSGSHLYNLVWTDDGNGNIEVGAYDPLTLQWVDMGEGQHRASLGHVLVP